LVLGTGTVASSFRTIPKSRMAVYLHFPSKAALLLALVEWMDSSGTLPALLQRLATIADPVERLLAMVDGAAVYQAAIGDVAVALRAARDIDDAARVAWNDRMAGRLAAIRHTVNAVAGAGRLAEGWSVRSATDAVFALSGVGLYEDLVRDRGWSVRRYATFLRDTVERLIVAPRR
jgi:AcrR family transcriptional regulator